MSFVVVVFFLILWRYSIVKFDFLIPADNVVVDVNVVIFVVVDVVVVVVVVVVPPVNVAATYYIFIFFLIFRSLSTMAK